MANPITPIEVDFNLVQLKIKEKLETAAAVLKEANDLAKSINTTVVDLDCYYSEEIKLFDELERCGWRVSSMNC